jgi:hypothetical protein
MVSEAPTQRIGFVCIYVSAHQREYIRFQGYVSLGRNEPPNCTFESRADLEQHLTKECIKGTDKEVKLLSLLPKTKNKITVQVMTTKYINHCLL